VIRAAIRRRRERLAAERQARHQRAQLREAADIAFAAGVRAKLREPVTDLHVTWPVRVTVGDVIAAAAEHFTLAVSPEEAAAMLRERLTFKGYAGWPDLVTDAWDYGD
jgi:hypothetical protein